MPDAAAMRACRRRIVLAAIGLAAGLAVAAGAEQPRDPALREAVVRLPVAGTTAHIVVTSYRPRGQGPFPWVLLNHGTALSLEANRAIGRNRNPALVREWLQRGYAVVAPVRRGYGASGGEHLADDYGGCAKADFERAGRAAALDLATAIEWTRQEPELDPTRWLLVGQSSGGFASIVTAAQRPQGLQAVLAFAPGRGVRPLTHPGQPCRADRLAELFADIAPRIAVPVLWFYARNDQYIGPEAQRLWFDRFRAAGGRGQLVVVPAFAERMGHAVFTSPHGVPLWTAAVSEFFKAYAVGLPFESR